MDRTHLTVCVCVCVCVWSAQVITVQRPKQPSDRADEGGRAAGPQEESDAACLLQSVHGRASYLRCRRHPEQTSHIRL